MFDKAKAFLSRQSEATFNARGPRAIGHLIIEKRYLDGRVERVEDSQNLVVTQAEVLMAQMAIGAADSAIDYIELGDPAAPADPPALINTTLQQTTGQRKAVSVSAVGNVATFSATWAVGDGNGFTYTEAGLHTGPFGSGSMFARKTFPGITKTASFALVFTWLITFLVQGSSEGCSGIGLTGPSTVAPQTIYTATGGEASIAALFDFPVGGNLIDVYLNGQNLYSGQDYVESASLTAPVGGPAANKGVNLSGFTLLVGWKVKLIMRALAP